jgi:EmrB/QacA subfamily drug resistance transporter
MARETQKKRAHMSIQHTDDAPSRSALVRRRAPLWAVTAVAALAQLMIVLDERVVNVALPSIRADLGMTTDAMQWVITAYLVTFGGLLLLAARLNDLWGRRRMLLIGLVVFTAASLVAGLASTGLTLVVARFLQGVGGAILAPASLTLIAAAHTDPAARRRAMGVWGMVTSAGAVAGVVLGGVLTSALGWRSVMFINVPIGLILIIGAVLVLVPSSRLPRNVGRVDVVGAILVTAGVAALVYGISAGAGNGWGSAPVNVALAAASVLLVAFVVVQSRIASPLLPLGIFRLPAVRNANLGLLSFGAVLTASLYFLSLYLQVIGHYSALQTGLALVPMSVLLGVGSILAPRLVAAGVRHLPVYGSLAATAGLVWLAFLPASGSYAATVLPPTLLLGAGFGVILVPLAAAATTGVEPARLGIASGLLNVSRQIGGAVGLAVIVSITAAITGTGTGIDATLTGYRAGFALSALLGLVTAVAVSRLHTPSRAQRRSGGRPA